MDLTCSLEESSNTWDQEVLQQEVEEVLEDLAVADMENNHPNGCLPHPVGDVMLYPNRPTLGELQQEVGGGALAWCQRVFGTQGPVTLGEMFDLLQVRVPGGEGEAME